MPFLYHIIGLFALFWMISPAKAITPYVPKHPDPLTETWRWTAFPELKGHGLRCLTQSQDGHMWFGTDEGVWTYDGVAYRIYTPDDGLLGAPIFALCASQKGPLYAGSALGISIYEKGQWRPLFPQNKGIPMPVNTLFETQDGTLWAGTSWGLLKADPTHPVLYTTPAKARVITQHLPKLTTVFLPANLIPKRPYRPQIPNIAGVGIRAIEGNWASLRSRNHSRVIWAIAPNSPAALANIQIGDHILAIDGIQPAWANDALKGAPNSKVTLTLQRPGEMASFDITLTRRFIDGTFEECPVYTLTEDHTQTLWMGLARSLIVRTPIRASQHDTTQTWQPFDINNTEELAYAPNLYTDPDQNLWVTFQSSPYGLMKFENGQFVSKTGQLIGSSLLKTKDGTLWIGGRVLNMYKDNQLSRANAPRITPHNYLHLLEAQNGALWVAGTGEGVVRFDHLSNRWQTYDKLTFFCDTPDGYAWFLNDKHQIVSKKGLDWQIWDPSDGAISPVDFLTRTHQNQVLAVGYQNGVLTTAIFDGTSWIQTAHATCQAEGPVRNILQTADGSTWLITTQSIGVFQQTPDGTWHHHTPPEAPAPPNTMAYTQNGHLWVAGWFGLRAYHIPTNKWHIITDHTGLTSYIDALHTDAKNHLWVGTRLYGVFQFDGQTWSQYNIANGIADINVSHIFSSFDNSIWAVTRNGISRYDGQTWVAHAVPQALAQQIRGNIPAHSISQSQDGTLWFNLINQRTVAYHPDNLPPETNITTAIHHVSQPGNTTLSWTGTDPWKMTPENSLQFSYRLNNEPWSPFSSQTSDIFLGLASGENRFEVRARDADFNIDPTPAQLQFTVAVPVWAQPWFIILVSFLGAAIIWQTRRVMQRNRQLEASHRATEIALNDLQASQQRLHTVVTNAPILLWAIDTSGTFTFLQGKEQTALNLSENNLLGQSAFDLFSAYPDLCNDLKRAISGEAFVSTREWAGITFEIHHTPLKDKRNDIWGAIGVATNITDRVRAESERSRLNEELRQLRYLYRLRVALGQARTTEEVIVQAGDALLTTLSSAVSAHVCLTLDDRDWTFGTPNNAHTYHYHHTLAWAAQTRGILAVETSLLLTESQERALLDETAGQITATLEARELEAQLLQSARLLSLGQMAAGVAHELNQPLAAISATAEGIYLRLESGMSVSHKKMMSMMEDILSLVDRMIDAINNLRIFSRDSSQEIGQRFNINDAVRASIKIMDAQLKYAGIQLTLNLTTGLPDIMGHPHQMEQVVLNLLSNAKDALTNNATNNKHILIRTYLAQSHTDNSDANPIEKQPTPRIVLEVQDNGMGIEDKHLPRLFEPFYTTKPVDKGTGIGLSIVFAIVQNHGGHISCVSTKEQPTTFRIDLPTLKETPDEQHRPQPAHSAR